MRVVGGRRACLIIVCPIMLPLVLPYNTSYHQHQRHHHHHHHQLGSQAVSLPGHGVTRDLEAEMMK